MLLLPLRWSFSGILYALGNAPRLKHVRRPGISGEDMGFLNRFVLALHGISGLSGF